MELTLLCVLSRKDCFLFFAEQSEVPNETSISLIRARLVKIIRITKDANPCSVSFLQQE